MQVTIHIGMPKCASSTVQAHFADNDELYQSKGLLYPTRHRLKNGYRHHNPLFEPDLSPDTAVQDLLREAGRKNCARILISTERFSTDTEGHLARITAAFARQIGTKNITCLCLVRDPASMLRSSFQQFVRAGLWQVNRAKFYAETDGSISAFLQSFRAENGFDLHEYDKIIARTTKGVTAGQLLVWDIKSGPDILTRLTQHFELPAGQAPKKQNLSFPPAKIAFLRQFQQSYGQEIYQQNRAPLLRKIDLTGVPMTAEDALRDGLDISDAALDALFPTLQDGFHKALALNGQALPLVPAES
ncbi:hypothetical protein [Pseudophaeobacter leonis]|uniref:hypothetical protein n=1 Tax=Pseudophaeobacter leonis TaxID=1144477 RepID=UPI00111C5F87|nr:hypothetical protein [Pseudophaeobacter leonis]